MNPFELYGVKEVADAIFFKLNGDGSFGDPALVLDTLKISTPEITAESTQQKGGKGNPTLLDWSYGKEITVTLQDALVSLRSLSTVLGGDELAHDTTKLVWKTEEVEVVTTAGEGEEPDVDNITLKYAPESVDHVKILQDGVVATVVADKKVTITGADEGDMVKAVYQTEVEANSSIEVVIGPNKFPGYYGMVGDTVIRRKADGLDQGFQFIMPKVKFNTQTTLNFESEGDAAVFDMELRVLVANNNTQMSLVRYDLIEPEEDSLPSNLVDFSPE